MRLPNDIWQQIVQRHCRPATTFELNASIRDITTPRRMRRLPFSPRDPVPSFVAWLGGVPDFRCIGLGKLVKTIHQHCCWLAS
jgi:hypothetical protein